MSKQYAIYFQALFKVYFFLNLPLTHMITKGCLSDFREGDFPLPLTMMVVGSPRFISLWYLSFRYTFSLSNVTVVAPTVYDGRAPSHVPYLPSWCYTKEEFSRDASWHDSIRWCWENFLFKWCWWEKFESNRIADVNLWCWWENFEPNPIKIKFIRR